MLATKLSRTAQRLHTPTTPITAATCAPTLNHPGTRTHQRRRSSSKASCPPDSSDKPASTAKTASLLPTPQTLRSKRGAKNRRPSQEKITEQSVGSYDSLPFVPQLHNLSEQEFGLSSFFALHRPLSVGNPIPQHVSTETFNAIFESRAQSDPWANGNSAEQRPEHVVYALAKTIEAIEEASSAAQHDILRADVTHEAYSNVDGAKHLDGQPQLKIPSLEEIIAQARPYQVPPPPQAFSSEVPAEKKRARVAKQSSPKTKGYTTTITLVESQDANGEKTFEASASPLVRLSVKAVQALTWKPYMLRRPSANAMTGRRGASIREPQGRRQLQPTVRKPKMLLISVKRQRKLKMKKHKYKKLMKRTRNLRRRLENK